MIFCFHVILCYVILVETTLILISVCTPDETNSTRCFCKSENDESGDTCMANQGCDKDGICFDGKYYLFSLIVF